MSELIKSSAEINTGMQAVELKSGLVSQLKEMNEDELKNTVAMIDRFLDEKYRPEYIMLLSNELRYYTLFRHGNRDKIAAKEIVDFLTTDPFLKEIGHLQLVDVHKDHIEIWIGSNFFALFSYDSGVVQI